jgi:simple sugar transport system permease protein
MKLNRLIRQNEFLVALTIVGLALAIGTINPVFFSWRNLFDLLRSATVAGIFAVGVLVVLISGGIDVSFTAIAVFAMYLTVKIMLALNYQGPILAEFALAALIGVGLGLINAFFISSFRLSTLIVTLGTQTLYRGFLLFVVGSKLIRDLPAAMTDFARSNMLVLQESDGSLAQLPGAFLILVAAALFTHLLLNYTMLGRGLYALGGAPEAAARAGFKVRPIQFFIYAFAGFLAGIAGMTYASMNRQANPFDIVGTELDVIAAVVLGGATLVGGRGSVVGTLLGVFLVVMLNNSLILVGVPTVWQRVVIGLVILIGTGIPAWQQRKGGRRLGVIEDEPTPGAQADLRMAE